MAKKCNGKTAMYQSTGSHQSQLLSVYELCIEFSTLTHKIHVVFFKRNWFSPLVSYLVKSSVFAPNMRNPVRFPVALAWIELLQHTGLKKENTETWREGGKIVHWCSATGDRTWVSGMAYQHLTIELSYRNCLMHWTIHPLTLDNFSTALLLSQCNWVFSFSFGWVCWNCFHFIYLLSRDPVFH